MCGRPRLRARWPWAAAAARGLGPGPLHLATVTVTRAATTRRYGGGVGGMGEGGGGDVTGWRRECRPASGPVTVANSVASSELAIMTAAHKPGPGGGRRRCGLQRP
jgi:hypothetical protein